MSLILEEAYVSIARPEFRPTFRALKNLALMAVTCAVVFVTVAWVPGLVWGVLFMVAS